MLLRTNAACFIFALSLDLSCIEILRVLFDQQKQKLEKSMYHTEERERETLVNLFILFNHSSSMLMRIILKSLSL